MRLSPIMIPVALTAVLLGSGCTGSRTDYPDNSPDTVRRVDGVKQHASDKKDVIAADYEREMTLLDFRERQIREEHRAEREAVEVSDADEIGERKRELRELELHAQRDRDEVDAQAKEQLRTSTAEQAATIKADAVKRKAAIDAELAEDAAPLQQAAAKETEARQRKLADIDLAEAKQLAALEQDRAAARNRARERRLEVDRWTTDELAKIEVDRDDADDGRRSTSVREQSER